MRVVGGGGNEREGGGALGWDGMGWGGEWR